jgi:FAD/FMN-containing dehydrogenase
MNLSRRAVTAGLLATPAILHGGRAALPSLPNIAPEDASFALPGTALYESTLAAYNLRTELRPALRILAKTQQGMRQAVTWLREKNLPFALRSGGHSFEGLSQSTNVVLDTRLMNDISLDARQSLLTVGAGTSLGAIYKYVGPRGFAFPGGSCPTVGVSGHTMGGGFGLMARERGLACDSLAAVDLVDADGEARTADVRQNPELFWALRGGGGGTFGAATQLQFAIAPVGPVQVYSASWALPLKQAVAPFAAWQDWAPRAPDGITGIFKVSKRSDGKIALHAAGQSTGAAAELRREMKALTDSAAPSSALSITPMSFLAAVNHFSGGWAYESSYSKGKSDYITRPLGAAGIEALLGGLAALPANEVIAICDAYGGALDRQPDDATAFAYRQGTEFCIQYYTSWASAAVGRRRTEDLRELYAAMRRWSGGAYVNYCDLDLPDWQTAYWRQNLARLKAAKARFDPENLFHHAQSVV